LADYNAGHIPGAVHVWWQDTIEVNNDVYGMLAGTPERARIIREAGITPASTVVVYDASGGRYAARVLWMLNAIGFDRVMVLNGGRQAWQASGRALTTRVTSPSPGSLTQQLNYNVLIGDAEIRQHLTDGTLAIVDNRTPAEQQQTWSGHLRVGRIPGAVDVPWTAVLQAGSVPYYASPAALSAAFAPAHLNSNRPVVVYGLDGVDAAQTYVALRLLGYRSVRVYDGSWAQWGADTTYPLAPLARVAAAG
ncbi:MAG TPA: rhodanese-like domain-containing protein, partial [Thermomicrobiaceae bacterium]|nr:rhodanese-like domain-containing protein [Thermomicrobiaceae bacterium]